MRLSRQSSWYGLAAAAALLLAPLAVSAITILPPCTQTGDCDLSDILGVFINFAEFLLSIMGAVALGFFVYGGFVLIMSGGKSEAVKKGKETLRNAVIGIAIILLSGVIVRLTSQALTSPPCKKNEDCASGQCLKNRCVPILTAIGESCKVGSKNGIYVSIPAGVKEDGVTIIPEEIKCIAKTDSENCNALNAEMEARGRSEYYLCQPVDGPNASSCVRGLCGGGAGTACCLCKDDKGLPDPCKKPEPKKK